MKTLRWGAGIKFLPRRVLTPLDLGEKGQWLYFTLVFTIWGPHPWGVGVSEGPFGARFQLALCMQNNPLSSPCAAPPSPLQSLISTRNFAKSSTQARVESGIREFGFGVSSLEKHSRHRHPIFILTVSSPAHLTSNTHRCKRLQAAPSPQVLLRRGESKGGGE